MIFNFDQYRPRKIVELNKKINEKWEASSGTLTIMGLERLVNKIVEGRSLTRREMVQFVFNLETICNHNRLESKNNDDLYAFIKESFEQMQYNEKDRVELAKYCYLAMLRCYKNGGYIALLSMIGRLCAVESSDNEYVRLLLDFYEKGVELLVYLKNIWFSQVEKYRTKAIAEFLDKTRVRTEMPIYRDMIIFSFKSNIEIILKILHDNYDNDLLELFESQKATISDKKIVFQNILSYYKNYGIHVDKFSKPWMNAMIHDLGEPLNRDPHSNWKDIREELFLLARKWYMSSRLEEMFGLKVNDQRRLEFWKRYLDHITDVYYHEYSNQAILMEMDRKHTVVEFGRTGNACYIYSNDFISIEQFEKRLKQNGKYIDYTYSLKNPYNAVVDKLIHSGDWEYRFAYNLLRLGYKRG